MPEAQATRNNHVEEALQPLVSLRLSIARRAADMRNFHFGETSKVDGRLVGQYALHISCPWRMDGPQGILTGRSDLWEHISGQIMPDDWEPSTNDNLQDMRIQQLLEGYDIQTDSFVNATDRLIVKSVTASLAGDAVLEFSGGYNLLIFPAGVRGEFWRIFRPGDSAHPHFVVDGDGMYSI